MKRFFKTSLGRLPVFIAFIPAAVLSGSASHASGLAFFNDEGRWVEPLTDANGHPLLLDYSYAGYHRGEQSIPDVAGPVFDVTDYGAVPNNWRDDTAGAQAAIDAAVAAGGGVVFFPPGVFHFHTPLGSKQPLMVRNSHIVLRGSGSGAGGTVLFKVNEDNGGWMVRFQAPNSGIGPVLTLVSGEVPRGGRSFEVRDSTGLTEGQWVVIDVGEPLEVVDDFMRGRLIPSEWTRILENGVPLREIHQIERIEGNLIRLKDPVKTALFPSYRARLRSFRPLEEIGVEDIAFMGNWLGHFVHHRSSLDDYHFNALSVHTAVNGWVRRCSFINLNQTLNLDTTANITVKHTRIAGTAPHSGHIQSRSTNNLLALSSDDSDGAWHNFQWRAQTAGAVFWRVDMHPVMPIDIHGMHAYGSLLDAIRGGYLMDSGGPVASFPHHGPGLVIWNFDYLRGASSAQRQRRRITIDLWANRPHVVDPVATGLHGAAGESGVNPNSFLVLESFGQPVEPESLYETQLAERLGGAPPWVAEAKDFWEDFRQQPLPDSFHPLNGGNQDFHLFPQDVPLWLLANHIQSLTQMRNHPNEFQVVLEGEENFRTDFMRVKTILHNALAYLHSFSVPFGSSTLYAQPAGPGTVAMRVEEREGTRFLVFLASYPHREPLFYYRLFPAEKNAFRKYIGENKAQEWDGAVEMVRSLGGSISKRNLSDGSEVLVEIPEMDPEATAPSLSLGKSAEGALLLTWEGRLGTVYQLQKSLDLVRWGTIGDVFTGTGEIIEHALEMPGDRESCFYRVITVFP